MEQGGRVRHLNRSGKKKSLWNLTKSVDAVYVTYRLSESSPRAKLIVPRPLEWRNWQTQQTQNLPPIKSNH
jgi:hypothetical protein